MEAAASASPEDLDAGLVQAKNVLLSHKYANPLHVDITIRLGGAYRGHAAMGEAVLLHNL